VWEASQRAPWVSAVGCVRHWHPFFPSSVRLESLEEKYDTHKMNAYYYYYYYYSTYVVWGLVLMIQATTVVANFPYTNVPLLCPETQPVPGKVCAMPDAKGTCTYGAICCPGEGGTCIPETYCHCSYDVWVCNSVDSGALPCPTICPKIAPTRTDSCDIAPVYQCAYNACDDDVATTSSSSSAPIVYRQTCYCFMGHFHCRSQDCPVPCPKTLPNNGDTCSAPFPNGTCSYGLLCCPEKGGKCIPDKTCTCLNPTISCDLSDEVLLCPSICPKTPPMTNDACNIDSRYRCAYGDAFVCDDDPTYAFEHEKECRCYHGRFVCVSNQCPVPCPKIPPIQGAACSPFLDYLCYYPLSCCPKSTICLETKWCRCEAGVIDCVERVVIEGVCPSDCPDPLVPDEVCLEVGNFGQCISGKPLICDDTRYAFPYEKSCDCNDRGIAKCVFHSCPVSCPEVQPRMGDVCVGYFADPCTYGQLCCPGPGGMCVPDTKCDCLESSRFHCDEFTTYASLPCSAVCPLIPPKTNDPCDIDQRYHCLYGDPLPCNDNDGYTIYDTQCWCHHKNEDDAGGTFVCNSYTCPPVICPEQPPVHGTTCSPFVGGTCKYSQQPCCPEDEGGGGAESIGGAIVTSCVANSTCSCDGPYQTVTCTDLPIVRCPALLPPVVLPLPSNGKGQMTSHEKVRKRPKK
jgi:hypothetical protein